MNETYEPKTTTEMVYRNDFYAEHETDRIIRETYFSTHATGTVIEVGAGKPKYLSQSKHFGDNGWRRICIDPIPWFAELHRKAGVEIYEFACSDYEEDNAMFQVVADYDMNWFRQHEDYGSNFVTAEAFSSLKVLDSYRKQFGYGPNDLPIVEIKVNVRKLDTIIAPLNLKSIDYLCVDTEGYELDVMRGFSIEKWYPTVILLEDILNGTKYQEYMAQHGYIASIKMGGLNQCYIRK